MKASLVIAASLMSLLCLDPGARATALDTITADRTQQPSADDDLTTLEREAAQTIASADVPFGARAALVARLERGRSVAPTPERRGQLALLWLQALRSTLAAIPMDGAAQDPYRRWLAAHESLAVYSEPAGQWLIVPDAIWKVHDAHRRTAAAESIAWLAVENGMPGECEGYVPCYAHVLDALYGEYLRRHPDGAHAADAARGIIESGRQSLRLLNEPDHDRFLETATDCAELVATLKRLRSAVATRRSAVRQEAVDVLDSLTAKCG